MSVPTKMEPTLIPAKALATTTIAVTLDDSLKDPSTFTTSASTTTAATAASTPTSTPTITTTNTCTKTTSATDYTAPPPVATRVRASTMTTISSNSSNNNTESLPASSTRPSPSRFPSYLNSLDKLVAAGLPRFGGGALFGTATTAPTAPSSSAGNHALTAEHGEHASKDQPLAAPSSSSAELISPNLSENGSANHSSLARKRSGATAAARARARARLRWPTSFEDLHQLLSVEYQFTRGRSLTSTGRTLLKEGYLMKEAPNKLPSMRKFFLFSDILVCGAPIKSTNRKLRLSMLSTASTISTNITPNGSDTALSVSLPTLTTGTAKIGSASSSSDHLKSSSLSLPSTTITNATIATTTSTASNPPTSSSQHIQFIEADMIKSKSAEKSTHLALPSGAVSACSLSRSSSAGNASTTSGSIPLAAPCTPLFERQIVISLGSLMVNLVGGDDYTISVTKGKESFSIRARSMAERDEWYKAFTDALTGYRELQARRAREQTPDLTTVVRRGGAGANAAMGSNRHPGHRSRTMDDGFRRSWAGSTVSHTLSISTKSPLSTETTGNTANNTYTANPNDPKTYSGERSSGVYDSLRFWQTPRVLQRKDSMSSEISRQSDLDGVAWVPDEMVDTCMVCKKTKFGMMVRKHHCRRCGFVICWNCSEMRRSISQPERKVRTCVDCVATCDGTGWMAVECQDDQPRDGTITSQIVNTPEKEFDSPTSRNNPETKPFEEDKAKLKEVDSEGQSLSSSKDTLDASCDTLTTLNNTAKSDL